MADKITEDEIIDMFINSTFIRGISLEDYKDKFYLAANNIKDLIEGKSIEYFSDSKNKIIKLSPGNPHSQLLEDYQRRLNTLNTRIEDLSIKRPEGAAMQRYKTKASCYRTFIAELERELKK